MPKNATILMIRHGEKPDTGDGLAVAGQERAQAYVVYFQNYVLNGQTLAISYLFASEDSSKSHRPVDTITPLATALNLSIDEKHKDKDFQKLADDLLNHSKYDNETSLVCWHHGEILDFAAALGASTTTLPSSSNWPTKWPSNVFGWVLQLVYDSNGNIVPAQTICISQQMMFDDTVQPPG